MKNLLKEGDVIYLENGMEVYTDIPEKFVYSNKKKSNEKTHAHAVIGRILVNSTDIKEDKVLLVKDIIHDFEFRLGIRLSRKTVIEFIDSKAIAPKSVAFSVDGGEFLVVKTKSDGGGTAMFNDVYPDGHHVFCKKLDVDGSYEDGIEVDFYQTGSFTAMIAPGKITVVRTLTPKFV